MRERNNRSLIVGLVMVVAFGVLSLAILMVGQEQALFRARDDYYLLLPNAEGLKVGSPVKLVGVQIGAVAGIELPDTPDLQDIRVTMKIDQTYSQRIREDTEAHLRNISLLGGEKFIELSLGSEEHPPLPPESEILASATDMEILTRRGTDIATDLQEITSDLRVVFDRIERQEGMLGQLLANPDVGDDIRETLSSVRSLSQKLEAGEGLVGTLLVDSEFRDKTTKNLGEVAQRMNNILARMEDPDTTLGALLDKEGGGAVIIENLQQASASFRDVARELESGDGVLPRLLHDEEYADRVLGNLEDTTRNLASITGKVDRGEGSIGGLVNDPELYEGLRDVVTGLQESRFLRWMVSRYSQKGRKARVYGDPGP
jgi:phospholipid/cholesterol/gamma-HCH transport system substrate-binding protein